MATLTHFDDAGQAHMVDVGDKPETARLARAAGRIRMQPATLQMILDGDANKGDVLGIARIAGIQAAKETARLIPLCHTLPLGHVGVEFARQGSDAVLITAEAVTVGATGVEMEAMVAASIAALTVYDMVKARCRGAQVESVRLLHKSGGKSGTWNAPSAPPPTA